MTRFSPQKETILVVFLGNTFILISKDKKRCLLLMESFSHQEKRVKIFYCQGCSDDICQILGRLISQYCAANIRVTK